MRKRWIRGLVVMSALIGVFHPILAATRVVGMPDRKVRPNVEIDVWAATCTGGACLLGDGSASGEAYSITFSGPNFSVTPAAPPLSGTLGVEVAASGRFVTERVSFSITAGTIAVATATITVGAKSDTVEIEIVDSADPSSNTPLSNQEIDRGIAVEEGLKYLYLRQFNDGSWFNQATFSNPAATLCASTGFTLWAFHINGHLPLNDPDDDVYAEVVRAGRDYLFSTELVEGTFAANADVAREAIADQTSDCNDNQQSVRLCRDDPEGFSPPFWRSAYGYSHAIAAIGILTGNDPAATTRIEDYVDWTGVSQNSDNGANLGGRGGWDYWNRQIGRGDMSIDAWQTRLAEGAELCYEPCSQGTSPDWILQEHEYELVTHQTDLPGAWPFGYSASNNEVPFAGFANGHATTCAGLTGLSAVELENTVPVGAVIAANATNLNTVALKRQAALDHLGATWGATLGSNGLGQANRGNFYSMGTCCMSLRLTERSGWDGLLVNGGVPFDWETGEENNSGNLAAPDTAREGYWPWLIRHQQGDGKWPGTTYLRPDLETSLALLCLAPRSRVFCPQEEGCPVTDPRTQGYWHRQCLGVPADEGGIDPGRTGRGPQEPNNPDFVPDLMACANTELENLGFYATSTCKGLDADPPSDKCEKALKQTTALILNVCNGLLSNACTVDVSAAGCSSTNVGDLLDELAALIQAGDCTVAANCAGAVNEGDALVDGGGGIGTGTPAVDPIERRREQRPAPGARRSGELRR